MAEHTPGPWHAIKAPIHHAGRFAENDHLIHTDDNRHIAEVFQYQGPVHKHGPAEANARLIAAAPDLLVAMSALVLPLREWLDDNPSDTVIRPEMTTTALRLGLQAYDKATS